MSEVTLQQILAAREERVKLQQQLLKQFKCPLICFTMNIAGPIKNTPLIQRGFRAGLDALEQQLPGDRIQKCFIDIADTGCTAMFAVQMSADHLKDICIAIEDATPLGRLFDMDVLNTDGVKLERASQRGCIICGAPGRSCAAGRLHSVAQLQAATVEILTAHFALADQEYIASRAVESLIDEVNTTPKPGLVDRRNNGSHKDMTIQHFITSANALKPYFAECVKIGQETAHLPPANTFPLLRKAGITAEKAMYRATGGVNTHKGAIYTMGILCGSIGRLWSAERPIADIPAILEECAKTVQSSVTADFAAAVGATAGEQLYLKLGMGGIRAEVAAGLPSVSKIGLPCYQNAIAAGMTPNDAGVVTLLHLIAQVDDTNLYHRGGTEGAKWASNTVKRLLQSHPNPSVHQLEALDNAFITRNLSPGGCADLLAVTYLLQDLTTTYICPTFSNVSLVPICR